MIRYEQYGREASWIVKRYGKYGRKQSWIVIRYGKYRRKVSWIVKRYGPLVELKRLNLNQLVWFMSFSRAETVQLKPICLLYVL